MSRSGVTLRPRYGRITALAAATSTTLVSLVGTLFTSPADDGDAAGRPGAAAVALAGAATTATPPPRATSAAAAAALAAAPSTGVRASLAVGLGDRGTTATSPSTTPSPTADPSAADPSTAAAEVPAPPRRSGSGRRVVFSESQQRVWLVGDEGAVRRTYLVSGSIYDNLDPGSYEVYSRSLVATGIDGSDLRFMVRFTQGDNAAIGFHSIPRMDGERMQTRAQLGTPLSHGCIRQAFPDARALWQFAPVGTSVVVTA